MYKCCECDRKFKTAKAANAAANNGCPGCGGIDIDIDPTAPAAWDVNRPVHPVTLSQTQGAA